MLKTKGIVILRFSVNLELCSQLNIHSKVRTKLTFSNKAQYLVIMYGCENWTKRRLSAKELMLSNHGVGEDSLRVLQIARRSNQSILKESNAGYSLERMMMKLNLQYFGHLM